MKKYNIEFTFEELKLVRAAIETEVIDRQEKKYKNPQSVKRLEEYERILEYVWDRLIEARDEETALER